MHATQISDAIIDCNRGCFLCFFFLFSWQRCQYHHVKDTQLYGNDNIVEFIESSELNGNDSYLNHWFHYSLKGVGNRLFFVRDSQILGHSNYMDNIRNAVLKGDRHFVSQVGESVILGEENSLHLSNQVVVQGDDHHVEFSGTVVGNSHMIIQGNGVYYGNQNTHVGTTRCFWAK